MFLFTSAEPQIDINSNSVKGSIVSDNLATRIRANQQKRGAELKPHYDFIVCGSGSSGSVVARRLAENADVNVFLLEAGGSDEPTFFFAFLPVLAVPPTPLAPRSAVGQ